MRFTHSMETEAALPEGAHSNWQLPRDAITTLYMLPHGSVEGNTVSTQGTGEQAGTWSGPGVVFRGWLASCAWPSLYRHWSTSSYADWVLSLEYYLQIQLHGKPWHLVLKDGRVPRQLIICTRSLYSSDYISQSPEINSFTTNGPH